MAISASIFTKRKIMMAVLIVILTVAAEKGIDPPKPIEPNSTKKYRLYALYVLWDIISLFCAAFALYILYHTKDNAEVTEQPIRYLTTLSVVSLIIMYSVGQQIVLPKQSLDILWLYFTILYILLAGVLSYEPLTFLAKRFRKEDVPVAPSADHGQGSSSLVPDQDSTSSKHQSMHSVGQASSFPERQSMDTVDHVKEDSTPDRDCSKDTKADELV